MNDDIPEHDWKVMRKLKEELLQVLCLRINEETKSILEDDDFTEHRKYQEIYGHIRDSDKIVADCFDDWSRSRLFEKLVYLQNHTLLTDSHIEQLTDKTQKRLGAMKEYRQRG